MKPTNNLIISGAREHNLKNISLELPLDKFIVITGLSGSGKSSLAFDTIYAEGQRRYVESLSAYARQFLGLMNKPDVDSIKGLSPAISIEQKSVGRNPRSTVGTITEIYDYLRLLYARIGQPYCYRCGKMITPQTIESITDYVMKEKDGRQILILSPVIRGMKGEYDKLFDTLYKKGFVRVQADGEVYELIERRKIHLNKKIKHDISIVIDRLNVRPDIQSRLYQGIESAAQEAGGLVLIVDGKEEKIFSQKNACIDCQISFEELQPRLFSFNSPFGACPRCHGLGASQEFDEHLIIPNKKLSLMEGAIAPWRRIGEGWRAQYVKGLGKHFKIDLNKPVDKLPGWFMDIVLHGTDEEIDFKFESKSSEATYEYSSKFEGIIPQLQRLLKQTESEKRRQDIIKFMKEGDCPECQGKRLKPEALSVKINDKNILDFTALSIAAELEFINTLPLTETQRQISKQVIKEIIARLKFLVNVGLDYLTLNRNASTLSGGEGQRIRLATQIGSELRGVMYILDEPSIGLHQRDNQKLISTLKFLRDLGNTLIVVEHDEETMRQADHLVDLGPGAGVHGGHVIFSGKPDAIVKAKNSLTGDYLSGRKTIPVPTQRRSPKGYLTITGATENNLKDVEVDIPLGTFTCVTGVSGSGKSTLINHTLFPALQQKMNHAAVKAGAYRNLEGWQTIDYVINVDQSPIGRTPRSNPATYIGLFTPIRDLFSHTKEAKLRGYNPGRFSFNVAGGRCENCEGAGLIQIEMHFLPDVFVECEQCKGKRYNKESLDIYYKNKNIADVLDMTVEEALKFFASIPAIRRRLQTLFDVGLSYIKLGQSATTLSGGEAQRIKLALELSKQATGNTLYILDEPTTGLHFEDINKLLTVLNRLVERGNTVLVIEHNLDVIKTADHLIDLGPEGGEAGGRVVAMGTPEQVSKATDSYTGQFLAKILP